MECLGRIATWSLPRSLFGNSVFLNRGSGLTLCLRRHMDGCRLPPSSSALVALSSLTPPSPILSPSQLSATFTSGHIPIYFDLDDEASSEDEARLCSRHMKQSSSITTIETVGTFGPTPRKRGALGTSTISLDRRRTADSFSSTQYMGTDSDHTCTSYFEFPSSGDDCGAEPQALPSTPSKRTSLSPLGPCIGHPVFSQPLCRPSPVAHSIPADGNGGGKRSYEVSPGRDDATRKMAIAAALACLESRCESAPSSPQYRRTRPPPSETLPARPKNLPRLDKTIVEMLIDQEGFRGVLARFKFSGFNNKQSLAPAGDTYGVAHFRPIYRQSFFFHYAPIDGLPVLRRITLNGDETRDYCSRQASLRLKSNGVYVIRGNELSSLHAPKTTSESPSASHGPKVYWRFEYFVDDRNVDGSGNKIADGEKILTPLSFSCSPLLFHPLQGKKIRLMHVMKKAVAPKLVAEKMEPPDIPSTTDGNAGQTQPPAETSKASTASPVPKSRVWSMHHWALSRLILHANEVDKTSIDGKATVPNTVGQPNIVPVRRRRASSAGEHSRPEKVTFSRDYRISPVPYCPPPGTHIIPPSRLTEMLDEEAAKASSHHAPLGPPAHATVTPFHALTFNPRHHPAILEQDNTLE